MDRDYFELLGLPHGFAVEMPALDAAYFAAQREWHPDRFARSDETIQTKALSMAAMLNNAYSTLKDPLARARYLLREQEEIKPDAALLMNVMEQREALEEAKTPQALAALAQSVAKEEADCLAHLAAAFKENNINHAQALTLRLSYIHKLKQSIHLAQKS